MAWLEGCSALKRFVGTLDGRIELGCSYSLLRACMGFWGVQVQLLDENKTTRRVKDQKVFWSLYVMEYVIFT